MNFLIPGGAGYIGIHIAFLLLDSGHDVVIIDNFSNSSSESIDDLENLMGRKITFYQSDISDETELNRIFTKHSFDAVIHLAALKSVSEKAICV